MTHVEPHHAAALAGGPIPLPPGKDGKPRTRPATADDLIAAAWAEGHDRAATRYGPGRVPDFFTEAAGATLMAALEAAAARGEDAGAMLAVVDAFIPDPKAPAQAEAPAAVPAQE